MSTVANASYYNILNYLYDYIPTTVLGQCKCGYIHLIKQYSTWKLFLNTEITTRQNNQFFKYLFSYGSI